MLIDTSGQLERGTTWFLRSRRLGDDMARDDRATSSRGSRRCRRACRSCSTRRRGARRRRGRRARGAGRAARARRTRGHVRHAVRRARHRRGGRASEAGRWSRWRRSTSSCHNRSGSPGCARRSRRCRAPSIGRSSRRARCRTTCRASRAPSRRKSLAGGGDVGARRRISSPAWQDRNRRALERATQLLAELRAVPAPDAAMLSVALRELRDWPDDLDEHRAPGVAGDTHEKSRANPAFFIDARKAIRTPGCCSPACPSGPA